MNDYISAASALHRSYIAPQFVNNLLENRLKMPQEKRAKILWTIFSMEVWYKKVYLNN